MKQFACKSCGSVDLFMKEKGGNTMLYCSDCGAYQQNLNKNDKLLFEEYKKNLVNNNVTPIKEEIDYEKYRYEYETIGKREMYWNIQCQLFAIDNSNLSNANKYIEFVKVLNSLGQVQQINESRNSTMKLIECSEVISDMRENSVNMREYFMNKYN